MNPEYEAFLASKALRVEAAGIAEPPSLNDALFPFQRAMTEWALRQGRAALFADTGLGKTLMQLEWARVVVDHTGGMVLVLTPLAVARQTEREAKHFEIAVPVCVVREQADCGPGINIANYERLHLLDPASFAGVVLDESSILKSFMGATKRALIEAFGQTPFRLCCTATPAPNDHMEIGNHSEFLGQLRSIEMLSKFFVNDTSKASQEWRIKGHAAIPFWDWVCSWASMCGMPSDLGFTNDGFVLPSLEVHKHEIEADVSINTGETLFRIPDNSATSIHKEKRLTAKERARVVAEVVAREPGEPWVIWCDTDYEADELTAAIPEAVEVRGSMPTEKKEQRLVDFSEGRTRILLTKPSVAGHGLNWQHCARMAFAGLSFSYESYYQAVRRCWRFGQKRPVHVHVAMADTEQSIWEAVSRKADDHDTMKREMFEAARRAQAKDEQRQVAYNPTINPEFPAWLTAA